ncbi:MAG: hypothetical protein KFF72_17795, partial [Arthrospira sp. SH-MAG29]
FLPGTCWRQFSKKREIEDQARSAFVNRCVLVGLPFNFELENKHGSNRLYAVYHSTKCLAK